MNKLIIMLIFFMSGAEAYTNEEFEKVRLMADLALPTHTTAVACKKSFEIDYAPSSDCNSFLAFNEEFIPALISVHGMSLELVTEIAGDDRKSYKAFSYIDSYKVLLKKIRLYYRICKCVPDKYKRFIL